MEEFDKILDIASKAWRVKKFQILNDKKKTSALARGCVAYIVNEYYPHLLYAMRVQTKIPYSDIRSIANEFKEASEKDEHIDRMLRRMTRILKLVPNKNGTDGRIVSCTKQLFGFDYTEEENLRREFAIRSANKWFEKKYGKMGVNPLKAGYAVTRE